MTDDECIRVAAAGDVHVDEGNRDALARDFAALDEQADLVLIAGDLTTHGEPEQAELFLTCSRETSVPVVAVLGNHDWHAGRHDEFVAVLREGGVEVLEGSSAASQARSCPTSASRCCAPSTRRRARR
jgi:predicted MPP superfamily phosphohydrolase